MWYDLISPCFFPWCKVLLKTVASACPLVNLLVFDGVPTGRHFSFLLVTVIAFWIGFRQFAVNFFCKPSSPPPPTPSPSSVHIHTHTYTHTHTHSHTLTHSLTYIYTISNKMTAVNWCMVVWCTQNAPRWQQIHVALAMPARSKYTILMDIKNKS